MALSLLYCPYPSQKAAQAAAKLLLSKRLIACANILASTSIYRWQGKIKEEKESILLAKTTPGKFAAAQKEIERTHSYKVPCILKIKAGANKRYEQWARKETR